MKIVRAYVGPDGRPQNRFGAVSAKPTKFFRREVLQAGATVAAAAALDCQPSLDPGAAYSDANDADRWGFPTNDVPPEFNGDPIVLSGSTQVRPGATRDVSLEALRNPFKDRVIEIHELRFWVKATQANVGSLNAGSTVVTEVNLTLGEEKDDRYRLTRQFVPIVAMGVGQLYGWETASGTTAQGLVICPLPKPLLLLPGERLRASFRHNGRVTYDINPRIACIGRVLPKGKSVAARWIPYAASTTFNLDATALVVSPDTDLFNETSDDVQVSRFGGRLVYYTRGLFSSYPGPTSQVMLVAVEDNENYWGDYLDPASPQYVLGGVDAQVISFRSRDGSALLSPLSNVPFRLAFGLWDRVLQANMTMAPHDYYTLEINYAQRGTDAAQAHVALIGSRLVSG